MMLSDHEIDTMVKAKHIGITPYRAEHLNPASVDLTLHPEVKVPTEPFCPQDLLEVIPDGMRSLFMDEEWNSCSIKPGGFILACTNEVVTIPDDIVARVEGKSSLGRLGLAVHITAGFIDPGFSGQITLEVVNMGPWPIILRPGARIAQIAFTRMSSPAERPYGSAGVGHYQGQTGPQESRFRMPPRG